MSEAVTLIESFALRARGERPFPDWAERFGAALARAPGHVETVRLDQIEGLHHLVSRFRSSADADAWHASAEYQALIGESEGWSVRLRQRHAGPAPAFDIPSEAAARKWKRFLVTVAGVFPTLLILNTSVRTLLHGWPPLALLAITSPLLTATLTWVINPRVQRWSRFWMLEDADGKLRKKPG